MINYFFTTNKNLINELNTIISVIESSFNCLMHTTNPLPTTLTYIHGYIGIQYYNNTSYIQITFFENSNEYTLKDSNNNIIYQAQPLNSIPTKEQIEQVISQYLWGEEKWIVIFY